MTTWLKTIAVPTLGRILEEKKKKKDLEKLNEIWSLATSIEP